MGIMYIDTHVCIYIYIYTCMYRYMIPVPGPVAPPQWYGPLLPDPESFISMVFTAFWMQNLILPILPTGTKEYSYITSLLPILPTGPTHLPHPQGGGTMTMGGDYIHPTGRGHYIHPTPIHRGEGGNHDHGGGTKASIPSNPTFPK